MIVGNCDGSCVSCDFVCAIELSEEKRRLLSWSPRNKKRVCVLLKFLNYFIVIAYIEIDTTCTAHDTNAHGGVTAGPRGPRSRRPQTPLKSRYHSAAGAPGRACVRVTPLNSLENSEKFKRYQSYQPFSIFWESLLYALPPIQ